MMHVERKLKAIDPKGGEAQIAVGGRYPAAGIQQASTIRQRYGRPYSAEARLFSPGFGGRHSAASAARLFRSVGCAAIQQRRLGGYSGASAAQRKEPVLPLSAPP